MRTCNSRWSATMTSTAEGWRVRGSSSPKAWKPREVPPESSEFVREVTCVPALPRFPRGVGLLASSPASAGTARLNSSTSPQFLDVTHGAGLDPLQQHRQVESRVHGRDRAPLAAVPAGLGVDALLEIDRLQSIEKSQGIEPEMQGYAWLVWSPSAYCEPRQG